jgi:cytochrome c2
MRLAVLSLVVLLAGCEKNPAVENGRLLLRQFGCGACHEIPGVAAAKGRVGPPLAGIGSRVYLAGVLPNSPGNMARFIRRPQEVDPRTAMPDLGVTEAHARDMVAYLQTLR